MTQSARRTLPHRRPSITFQAEHCASGQPTRFAVSVGYLDMLDGVPVEPIPVEVFISGTKAGSEVEATARDGAVLLSIALQYGVPLNVMRGAITREQNGAPSSIIGAVVDQIATQAESPFYQCPECEMDVTVGHAPSCSKHPRSAVMKLAREEIAKVLREGKNANG